MRLETSAEVIKLRSERNSATVRRQKLLVFKAREERKNKVAETVVKLHKIFDEGRKVMVDLHMTE